MRRLEQRLNRFSTVVAVVAMATSALVLVGWALDIAILKGIAPGLATMKANTAFAFLLSGMGLWLCRRSGPSVVHPSLANATLSQWCAAAVVLIAALTLCEYIFGVQLGIDELLVTDTSSAPGRPPGRMSIITAVNFGMLGAALAAKNFKNHNSRRLADVLSLATLASAFVVILGYLFGVESLYRVFPFSSVAVHTALLFLLLAIALLCTHAGEGLMSLAVDVGSAGIMIRRLLPAVLLVPPTLGWLCLIGEDAGLYSVEFGLALFAVSNTIAFGTIVWLVARTTQGIEAERDRVQLTSTWQEAILNSADLTIISTDCDGRILTCNAGALRKLGYAREEIIGKVTPVTIHDPQEMLQRARVLSVELGRKIDPGFEVFVAKARLGGADENDWTYVRKDGSRFTVRLSVTAVYDRHGVLTGFLGIGRDISRQKLAEENLRDSEQRLRLIADGLPALVTYVDTEERYRFCNAMVGRVFGVDTADMIGRTMREVRGEAIYRDIAPHVAAALRGETVSFEGQGRAQDRNYYYQSDYVPDIGPDGRVRGFFAMTFDLTARKDAEMRLAASERRLRLIADNLPALIAYIDAGLHFRFNNRIYERWLGLPLDEITGRPVADFYSAEVMRMLQPQLEAALAGRQVSFEAEAARDNEVRQLRVTFVPDSDADGQVHGIYALGEDITELKRVERSLRTLTHFDSLTGLANRNRFDEKLGDAIARSERSGETMAVMFLDLDHFKSINDTLGHKGGDAVLQEFARRITKSVRRTDTVARLAGDEFVIILEQLNSPQEADTIADKIVAAMSPAMHVPGGDRQVSVSIGIAVRDAGEIDPEALLHRADEALYKAKAAGRGTFIR